MKQSSNAVLCVLSPGCGGEGWLPFFFTAFLIYCVLACVCFVLRGLNQSGGRVSGPPGKSQVAISFLKSTGTDPPREAIGPKGPIASGGRFVLPSLKNVDD